MGFSEIIYHEGDYTRRVIHIGEFAVRHGYMYFRDILEAGHVEAASVERGMGETENRLIGRVTLRPDDMPTQDRLIVYLADEEYAYEHRAS